MDEREWLDCTDPVNMLDYASDRQLRLYMVACICRFLKEDGGSDPWAIAERHHIIEALERHADGGPLPFEMVGRATRLGGPFTSLFELPLPRTARIIGGKTASHFDALRGAGRGEQCQLLRDIIGNPFRPPSIDPAWLTPSVTSLATAIYEERLPPSRELDPVRLAVLSDAVEEAGCTDAAILGHLRGPGPHVRGCFAVDLLLGRA